jgi:pimeloyl-ACP methyl ester carboxylesterase
MKTPRKHSHLLALGVSAILFAVGLTEAATKTGLASVNGVKLYYEVHGTLDGKTTPLVLLHGGGSTLNTSFSTLIPDISKTRPVIAFDQRGHGRSADNDQPFSFEGSADDTAALLKYLKVKQADFLGYSNGGSIALQIGMRHPKLTRKLIIASAMTKRSGMVDGFWDGFKNASLANMPTELKEEYTRVSPHPEKLQSFHDKSVARMENFKDWKDADVQTIKAPTMILIGDADVIKPEHAVEMYRLLLPISQLAILPGINHMTLVTNWPVQLIEKFLNEPAVQKK